MSSRKGPDEAELPKDKCYRKLSAKEFSAIPNTKQDEMLSDGILFKEGADVFIVVIGERGYARANREFAPLTAERQSRLETLLQHQMLFKHEREDLEALICDFRTKNKLTKAKKGSTKSEDHKDVIKCLYDNNRIDSLGNRTEALRASLEKYYAAADSTRPQPETTKRSEAEPTGATQRSASERLQADLCDRARELLYESLTLPQPNDVTRDKGNYFLPRAKRIRQLEVVKRWIDEQLIYPMNQIEEQWKVLTCCLLFSFAPVSFVIFYETSRARRFSPT